MIDRFTFRAKHAGIVGDTERPMLDARRSLVILRAR
jgi:hypothetical protein